MEPRGISSLGLEHRLAHYLPAILPVIYGLLEYNIPGDITGRNEPELNSIFNIPGIRGYR
jgi:hypothetical protein